MVLVDHAAEYLAALHRRAVRDDGWLVMVGWPLAPGLVRPVARPDLPLPHLPALRITRRTVLGGLINEYQPAA